MTSRKRDRRTEGRVVWAIFVKDLREVIRNKNTIAVLISGLFIVAMYRLLPNITRGLEPTRVWVYDQGQSGLAAFLENSTVVDAWAGAESLAKVQELLRESEVPELGLVIPPDFDQRLERGGEVSLQGYRMSWLSAEEAAELRQSVEDEIARLLGRRVAIKTEGNVLHLTPEAGGPGIQASLAAVFMLTMLGASLVPHLVMAEKQERTLDVLLTSPASEVHVVLAKALTGMVYCLIGGAIALAANHALVEHWWLAILGVVVFSGFAVALGLALGAKIENRAQLGIWSWVVFIPMFIPAIAVLLEGLIPDGVIQVLRFTPTVAFCTVWRFSFAQSAPALIPLAWLGYLLLWMGAVLGVVMWLIGQRDRQAERRVQARGVPQASRRTPATIPQIEAKSAAGGRVTAAEVLAMKPSLGSAERGPLSRLRIVAAIFAKDLREALDNKLFLSVLVGSALVLLNGAALPMLLEARMKPAAVVYDEGHSTLLRGLMIGEEYSLRLAESRQDFEETLTSGPGTWLGLILPADFDQRIGEPAGIELEGYAAHWADEDKIRRATAVFEEQLGLAAWTAVHIDLEGHRLYPDADAGGQIAINLTTLVIAMTAIGVAMVPLLIIEEKESHTLETLLVSPARLGEVILGKGLVGGTYCLLGLAVGLLFNLRYIVHWEIVLLAGLVSAAFVVALGMLIGVLADNPASAALWAAPALLIILVPAAAQAFVRDGWPEVVRKLLPWAPGSVMLRMLHLSAAGQAPGSELWPNLAALAGTAAAVYGVVAWRVRKLGG